MVAECQVDQSRVYPDCRNPRNTRDFGYDSPDEGCLAWANGDWGPDRHNGCTIQESCNGHTGMSGCAALCCQYAPSPVPEPPPAPRSSWKVAAAALTDYRSELQRFRAEFGGGSSRQLPDVAWFLFGMGKRRTVLYKAGALYSADTATNADELFRWNGVSEELIVPSRYQVILRLADGGQVCIFEDEAAVWIEHANGTRTALAQTTIALNLPRFASTPYPAVMRVLLQESLINIRHNGGPTPNLFAYRSPWYRDGAMLAMVLAATNNTDHLREWIVGLNEPYDYQNAGNAEPDNLGQVLFLISLVSDAQHPLVARVLAEAQNIRQGSDTEPYISGHSDFAPRPRYQTAWLKLGLNALGLNDPWVLPNWQGTYYDTLFWMPLARGGPPPPPAFPGTSCDDYWRDDYQTNYPYLGWACDHRRGAKRTRISDRDWPLTYEADASQADYNAVGSRVDWQYNDWRVAAPHIWHAAEIMLYLLDLYNVR